MDVSLIVLLSLVALVYLQLTGVLASLLCRLSPQERRRLAERELALRGRSGYGPRDRSL